MTVSEFCFSLPQALGLHVCLISRDFFSCASLRLSPRFRPAGDSRMDIFHQPFRSRFFDSLIRLTFTVSLERMRHETRFFPEKGKRGLSKTLRPSRHVSQVMISGNLSRLFDRSQYHEPKVRADPCGDLAR